MSGTGESEILKTAARNSASMFTLLEATSGLPINALGWGVTVVGLAVVAAWLAYLYR